MVSCPTLGALSGRGSAATSELKSLELLYEVEVSLARSQPTDEVTASAIQLLFRIKNVQRETVMLRDEQGPRCFQMIDYRPTRRCQAHLSLYPMARESGLSVCQHRRLALIVTHSGTTRSLLQ